MTSLLSETIPNYQSKQGDINSVYVPQPFLNYAGLTKMLTSDYKYTPKPSSFQMSNQEGGESTQNGFGNTLFQSGSNKNDKQKNGKEGEKNSEDQEEDTIGFWINNINTGDVYRSFIKGTNPWAKSSGFTQLLQDTRGAFQYYQNVKDSPMDPNYVKAIEEDKKLREEFLKKEQEEKERLAKIDEEIKNKSKMLGQSANTLNSVMPQIDGQEIPTKVSDETINKILKGCSIRGWVGLRALKCYLRNLSAHKSEIINKNDFKYHLAKQAILLNDYDVDTIFAVHDKSKSDFINYISFLNSINRVNQTRKAQIESFKDQVKVPGQDYIYFSTLMSLVNMNYHPEAIQFLKTVPDLVEEYAINWDNLKEDNRVTENDFRQFFYDISSCVQKDEDFTQILKSLGYK